jgi:hypothetical protein
MHKRIFSFGHMSHFKLFIFKYATLVRHKVWSPGLKEVLGRKIKTL